MRTDPTITVSVEFPDGPRDVPAHYALDTQRALYTGGVGGHAPSVLTPNRIPGYMLFETTDGWKAVKENHGS